MVEVRLGRLRILWTEPALEVFSKYRKRGGHVREAGGILLGEVSDTAVLVTRASSPSSRDLRSRFGFIRDKTAAQRIVDQEHRSSGGRITYLGEWHTHPAARAVPSAQDERMIREQLRQNIVPAGFLLLVIIAWEYDYVGLFINGQLSGSAASLF